MAHREYSTIEVTVLDPPNVQNFTDLQNALQLQVLAAFGVNPSLLGMTEKTNYKEGREYSTIEVTRDMNIEKGKITYEYKWKSDHSINVDIAVVSKSIFGVEPDCLLINDTQCEIGVFYCDIVGSGDDYLLVKQTV